MNQPVKFERWQYIQLLGTTLVTFLGIFCGIILIGILITGIHLVKNGEVQWYTMGGSYLVLIGLTTWWLPNLFRWLYFRKRLNRINTLRKKKRKESGDEEESFRYEKLLNGFALLALIGILFLTFTGSLDGIIPKKLPSWIIELFKEKWFWIGLIGTIALVLLIIFWKKIFGKMDKSLGDMLRLGLYLIFGLMVLKYGIQFVFGSGSSKNIRVASGGYAVSNDPYCGKKIDKSTPAGYTLLRDNEVQDVKAGVKYCYLRKVGQSSLFEPSHDGTVVISYKEIAGTTAWEQQISTSGGNQERSLLSGDTKGEPGWYAVQFSRDVNDVLFKRK